MIALQERDRFKEVTVSCVFTCTPPLRHMLVAMLSPRKCVLLSLCPKKRMDAK